MEAATHTGVRYSLRIGKILSNVMGAAHPLGVHLLLYTHRWVGRSRWKMLIIVSFYLTLIVNIYTGVIQMTPIMQLASGMILSCTLPLLTAWYRALNESDTGS